MKPPWSRSHYDSNYCTNKYGGDERYLWTQAEWCAEAGTSPVQKKSCLRRRIVACGARVYFLLAARVFQSNLPTRNLWILLRFALAQLNRDSTPALPPKKIVPAALNSCLRRQVLFVACCASIPVEFTHQESLDSAQICTFTAQS